MPQVILPAEVLQLIFEELVGDATSLAHAGLVSRSWRDLSLPVLLKKVDLSCHNDGRLPEHEDSGFPLHFGVVMADQSDKYRPHSLVPRQRAFLRLMVDRPELSTLVRAFTWTLVWRQLDEDDLADIDFQTWNVFARLQNVTRLDLASLHDIVEPQYIRQNPARLFPSVTDLRLVGWMSRGLVRAIVTSIDVTKLRRLELDHLQDEGALPNGLPMPQDLATKHLRDSMNPHVDEGVIDDELWARQEQGHAGIFPGSMWSPLRTLRQNRLASIAHFQIRLGSFTDSVDPRNDITMFSEIVEFIRSSKNTLKTISISVGEAPILHCNDGDLAHTCGTSRSRILNVYRPFCFDQTTAFLHRLLPVLAEERFPTLTQVTLEGFRIIHNDKLRLFGSPDPALTWQYVRNCPFIDDEFTKIPNNDYRKPFDGYDFPLTNMTQDQLDQIDDILERS